MHGILKKGFKYLITTNKFSVLSSKFNYVTRDSTEKVQKIIGLMGIVRVQSKLQLL